MKVLFLFFGGIGNAVLLTPALRALSSLDGGVEIDVVLRDSGAQSGLQWSQRVRHFYRYDRPGNLRSRLIGRLGIATRVRSVKYDYLVSTASFPGKETALAAVARARRKVGLRSTWYHNALFDYLVPFSNEVHESQLYLSLVQPAGATGPATLDPPVLPAEDRSFAAEALIAGPEGRPTIGFHVGSSPSLAYKRWPAERFAEVARSLAGRTGARIVVFGGPLEAETAAHFKAGLAPGALIDLTGRTSLGQAAACISRCDLFVSNDSGLAHIAAAAGVATVAVFGPTSIPRSSPLGPRARVVSNGGPCPEALPEMCGECGERFGRSGATPLCLAELPVSKVLAAAEEALQSGASR